MHFIARTIGFFFFIGYGSVYGYTDRTSGLAMDPALGNDYDLMRYLQSDRVGKDCIGVDCDDDVVDDGCMCDRDCSLHPEPRTCYYRFVAEQYTAMGPACQNCSTGNTSNCYANQCVVVDGREKTILIINRMVPGPTISVCKNDLIIVDVINIMTCQAMTIHWHGLRQLNTNFMDGVPFLTQCPIHPGGQFRYKFRAEDPGTRWWHPHLGNIQRCNMNGVIRTKLPREQEPDFCDYDYDLACHIINVDDSPAFLFDYEWPGYWQNKSHMPMKAESLTINGFGSFNDNTTKTITPQAEFWVKCGKSYRFRLVATLSINCMIQFAIEEHNLTIIALDGDFVKPQTVQSIVSGSGMRTDFILYAKPCNETQNSTKCSYYITVKALEGCLKTTLPQTAYLVYGGCSNSTPSNAVNYTSASDGVSLDYVDKGCNLTDVICSDEFESYEEPSDPRVAYDGQCDIVINLVLGHHAYNYSELFNSSTTPYQPYYIPTGGSSWVAETINNVSAMFPPCVCVPPNKFQIPDNMICPETCDGFCCCIPIYKVPTNSCVELRLNETQGSFDHPFHLHGHNFYVLKMGTPAEKTQPNFYEDVQKTRYPPKRDTAILMAGGYLVLRWIADNPERDGCLCWWEGYIVKGRTDNVVSNEYCVEDARLAIEFRLRRYMKNYSAALASRLPPRMKQTRSLVRGYWLFHCHLQSHMMGGMFVFFKIGEDYEMTPYPKGFPECNPYLPSAHAAYSYSPHCNKTGCGGSKYSASASGNTSMCYM